LEPQRVLNVSSSVSPNLAQLPQTAVGDLEVQYAASSTSEKQPIKSLYRYEVSVSNNTGEGVENLAVFLILPTGVQLSETPSISSSPDTLAKTLMLTPVLVSPEQTRFDVGLLNPAQSVRFTLFGYSGTAVEGTPLSVLAQKKDWKQVSVDDAGRNTSKISLTEKPLADFTGMDLIISASLFMFLIGALKMYFRVVQHSFYVLSSRLPYNRFFWLHKLMANEYFKYLQPLPTQVVQYRERPGRQTDDPA
jgi:hypothetical protein